MNLSLLVIRCKDLEASKNFYVALGLSFTKEQHGDGPEHFASEINGIVFELYPHNNNSLLDKSRLGFKVNNLGNVLSSVQVHSSYEYAGNTIYVLVDPDGRKVEVSA
ncbi:MAG: hypothetical protein KTR17_04310 [Cellvibrionaceae bacterium]|nr:hypothetical protein [Cellvibrionaceae bacterium]